MSSAAGHPRVVLIGNPNTGKTTLFNRLCGLRHKTSNFPGTTLETRIGRVHGGSAIDLIDSPGAYSLNLDQTESQITRDLLDGGASSAAAGVGLAKPDAVCVVADAMNLPRSLQLVGEVLRFGRPMVVAINMADLAAKRGLTIDVDELAEQLGVPCVLVSARKGKGIEALIAALDAPAAGPIPPESSSALSAWAQKMASDVTQRDAVMDTDSMSDRIDRVATHPVLGLVMFALVMTGLFWVIFKGATYPMDLIDGVFSAASGFVEGALPEGVLRDLLANGVIGGVGATVIFLPQICLLFFLIALLEDTGYLARAAFVVDRLLRPFGLPGHAFVPLLSSHACALPGIMATRSIPDPRERLATILVAPFMSCTARIPVYVLLVGLLFTDRPAMAALAFAGCYLVGLAAAIFTVLIARRTILRGESRAMTLELPSYKVPSLRTALMTTYDSGFVFLKKAGTAILAIAVVLWWLGTYPLSAPPAETVGLRAQAAQVEPADVGAVESLLSQADRIESQHASANSFAGRIGKAIQPVFAPLGYDWKLTVGVVTSFAAREVFVTTMSVITSGDEELEGKSLRESIASAKRDDGVTPVFTRATSWSLLIYYILAMQCLPTLAVTAKESGAKKWALLQLAWMSGMAYVAAMIVYQVMK
ncbi:MAG: ferrous iron transport protein B [Phycisphaerales bacterium]|jgi:ferrous iron transport protein B